MQIIFEKLGLYCRMIEEGIGDEECKNSIRDYVERNKVEDILSQDGVVNAQAEPVDAAQAGGADVAAEQPAA